MSHPGGTVQRDTSGAILSVAVGTSSEQCCENFQIACPCAAVQRGESAAVQGVGVNFSLKQDGENFDVVCPDSTVQRGEFGLQSARDANKARSRMTADLAWPLLAARCRKVNLDRSCTLGRRRPQARWQHIQHCLPRRRGAGGYLQTRPARWGRRRALSRAATISALPFSAARCSGVSPCSFRVSGSAPASSKVAANSALPSSTARCNGCPHTCSAHWGRRRP